MDSPNAGQIGGIFAGLVAALVAIGHGLRWLMGYEERRDRSRTQKLDAWQRELEARERAIDDKLKEYWTLVERELETLRREHAALRQGYQLVASALRSNDPENPALRHADELLRAAFPPEPLLPPDMVETLKSIP
jgi:hypothetical protein